LSLLIRSAVYLQTGDSPSISVIQIRNAEATVPSQESTTWLFEIIIPLSLIIEALHHHSINGFFPLISVNDIIWTTGEILTSAYISPGKTSINDSHRRINFFIIFCYYYVK
jgi:hypothetical protein